MKKQIINILILLMYSALCFASSPKWLTDLEKAFPTEDYVRAIGEGNSYYFGLDGIYSIHKSRFYIIAYFGEIIYLYFT